ncbi:MAG: restriction endonuclease, SacI family, partial [Deltaproteobacteria bacterium]|nr:restriction endonuclease, SacI family [Deltaproteobacteria bacterium]
YGAENVESGRINDPSRKYPGDVCVRSALDPEQWGKAIEVRAKPVSDSDVQVFARKCLEMGVLDVSVVAVSSHQAPFRVQVLTDWAEKLGIGLTLFVGWAELVEQALFWSQEAKLDAAHLVALQIHARLVGVEASTKTLDRWAELTSGI